MRIKILTLALLLMIANQTTSLAPKDIPCKLTNENTEITGEIEDEIENEENEQEDEVENEDVATQNNQENANNKKEDEHDGLVYVEGFGYVKDSGPAQGKTVHSDGDINKMVGTMDQEVDTDENLTN